MLWGRRQEHNHPVLPVKHGRPFRKPPPVFDPGKQPVPITGSHQPSPKLPFGRPPS